MKYGVPYKGSKNKIARKILDVLPQANTLYDVFAGGCAISHCAYDLKKYNNIVCNDIDDVPFLFVDALKGKQFSREWIDRETFKQRKNETLIKLIWSFGNNGKNYMYSKEIEPWKKALHYARCFGDFSLLNEMGIDSDGTRSDIKAHKDEYKKKYIRWWLSKQNYSTRELDALIAKCKDDIKVHEEQLRQYLCDALKQSGLKQADVDRYLGTQMSGHYFGRSQWEFPTQETYEQMQRILPLPQDYNEVYGLHQLWQSLQSLESLESLERLERLERLQSLERLERLESLQSLDNGVNVTAILGDYRSLIFDDPNGVIYCDIPYQGTDPYNNKNPFDYGAFYDWCESQTLPVYISEYAMPEDRFVCVAQFERTSLMCNRVATKKKVIEKIFRPIRQVQNAN